MRWVAILLALPACIAPDQIACGELVCSAGSVCLPNHTCASGEAVAACTGLADGATCTTPLFTGTCADGACTPPVCGDGVVSGSEQCDGAVAVDCADFGFDLGTPTCNANCDLDLVGGCTRFGWKRIVSGAMYDAWKDAVRFAWIPMNGVPEVHTGAQVATFAGDGSWSSITGGGPNHVVVAYRAGRLVRFDGTTWKEVDAPPGQNLKRVIVAPDGTLYALMESGCVIARLEPGDQWTTIRSPGPDDCPDFAVDATGHLFAGVASGTTGRVDGWTGTQWPQVFYVAENVLRVQPLADGSILAGSAFGGLYRWRAGTIDRFLSNGYVDVLTPGAYAYVGDSSNTYRLDRGFTEELTQPIYGTTFTDGTDLFVVGNGIYQYTGMSFAQRAGITFGVTDLRVLSDQTIMVATGNTISFADPNGFVWNDQSSAYDKVSIAGANGNDIYSTDGTTLEHFTNNVFATVTPPGFANIARLWMDGSTLYAIGDASLTLVHDTAWTTLAAPTPGCSMRGIDGGAAGIFAVGTCGGVGFVWQRSGAAWTVAVASAPPLVAVSVAPDGDVVAVGPSGGMRLHAGAWTAEPAAIGASVSATAADDVWVAGGPDDVTHWDGHTWSRLAVEGATTPLVVATPGTVYFAGIQSAVLLR